jgi:hypothetical protein
MSLAMGYRLSAIGAEMLFLAYRLSPIADSPF